MPVDRTGLLLIRVWIEAGAVKPLRAHIRTTTDVARGFESELTVAEIASTLTLVEAWLTEILADVIMCRMVKTSS